MMWWRLHKPTNRDYELVESLTELQAASDADDPVRAMREMVRFSEKLTRADKRLVRMSMWPWIISTGALYGWLCYIQRSWVWAMALGIVYAFIMTGNGRNLERTKTRIANNKAQLDEMRQVLAHLEGHGDGPTVEP